MSFSRCPRTVGFGKATSFPRGGASNFTVRSFAEKVRFRSGVDQIGCSSFVASAHRARRQIVWDLSSCFRFNRHVCESKSVRANLLFRRKAESKAIIFTAKSDINILYIENQPMRRQTSLSQEAQETN
jgi:hypothetical protein